MERPLDPWLDEFRRGDPAAFDRCVRDTRPALGTFLKRILGSPEDVDDILQETYLRAFRSRESFDAAYAFKTWLFTIAMNASRDLLRARRRPTQPAAPPPAAGPGEIGEQVRRLVRDLPPGQREVFVLRRYEELTYADIGRALGITTGAVKAQMHHALAKIRTGLERLGMAP